MCVHKYINDKYWRYYMTFEGYYQRELKESVSLNENTQIYGYTSKCKANEPFVAAHEHTYYMNSYGFGWTGPASEGNAHIHQILNGKIVEEGDGHTHELLEPTKKGSDAVDGVDPVRTLQSPIPGSQDHELA